MTLPSSLEAPPLVEVAPARAVPAPTAATPRTFTLEALLWLLLGMAALWLRLFDLARWTLAEPEAALATEAWRWVSGQPYTLVGPALPYGVLAPLPFNLQGLLFTLFGASDTTARAARDSDVPP